MLSFDIQLRRDSVSFDLRGELAAPITGVCGPSGSGKTTLLHMLAGLVRPDAGRIALDDTVLFDSRRRINVAPHRRGVVMVFQEHRLFPHYSARRNLRYGMKNRDGSLLRRWSRTRATEASPVALSDVVDLLEIGGLLDRRVDRLSGGQRQRVALGRALLASPRLLLLDEPLAALDGNLKQQILPYLRRVRQELRVPMLLVSHDLAEILHLTDRLLLVRDGRSMGSGSLLDLIQQPAALRMLGGSGMVNPLRLKVEVTHQAAAELNPRPGKPVWRLFKARALQCFSSDSSTRDRTGHAEETVNSPPIGNRRDRGPVRASPDVFGIAGSRPPAS